MTLHFCCRNKNDNLKNHCNLDPYMCKFSNFEFEYMFVLAGVYYYIEY
jgi:hypothetical protein